MLIFGTTRNHDEIFFLLSILFLPNLTFAWGRLGDGATPVTQNSGDKGVAFTVSVGTTSARLVYSHDDRDREIFLQDTDSTFYVACGTHSAVSFASGPRFLIPPKPSSLTTNANYSIYCIADPAGTTIEVLGIYERDKKD